MLKRSKKPTWSRKEFLKAAGTGLAGASLFGVAGCGGNTSGSQGSAGRDIWKQFKGKTIQFISENTPPTSAIAANSKPFTEKTGIKVKIIQLELGDLVEKVALDFGSGKGQYHVIYADPYQVLAPYHQGLANLNDFNNDDSLPSVPKGLGDFIPTQLQAAGLWENKDTLLALPYDAPTMIWIYRKDLFEKYGDRMKQDLGFDPTPSGDITWEQYYKIADWFNKNAKKDVPYGTGHQAKQYDSLMCDFSNVLSAYGGDYFKGGQDVGKLGTSDPGPSTLDSPEAIEAAKFYKKLLSIAHPGSTSWDWTDLGEAFQNGQIAMCPEWHEFAASFESPGSKVRGKVGFSILPKGPARSANIYGGTGIGINNSAPEDLQKAAWLFVVWATSPETQKREVFSKKGGGTPTRQSVYEIPQVKKAEHWPSKAPNMLTYGAVSKAWEPQNIYLRPKIPQWNKCDTVIYTELSKMLAGDKSPEQAMRDAKSGIDQAVKSG